MVDSHITIVTGTGPRIDTRTTADGDHRQVVALGDPATDDVAGVNDEGRLKVSTKPAAVDPVVMNVSAVQAAANTPVASATAFMDVSRVSNVVMYVTGTFAGMNCVFEASLDSTNGTDGTWFGIQAVRSNANTIETATGTLSAAPVYAWEMSVNAYAWVRVRCTARTSGTQVWRLQAGTYATEPIPAIQVHGITGNVAVIPGAGTPYSVVTAASTNAAAVKASAGTLAEITISNPTTTSCNVKLYNKASAPTVGTDIPVLTIPVPAGTAAQASLKDVSFGQLGKRFTIGIAIAVTANAAASDTGAAPAGVQIHATYI